MSLDGCQLDRRAVLPAVLRDATLLSVLEKVGSRDADNQDGAGENEGDHGRQGVRDGSLGSVGLGVLSSDDESDADHHCFDSRHLDRWVLKFDMFLMTLSMGFVLFLMKSKKC